MINCYLKTHLSCWNIDALKVCAGGICDQRHGKKNVEV